MNGVIAIYKKKGETPLQSLDRLRAEKTEYRDAVLSYAGRLDPMAEGVMLVLVGDENKNREKYLELDKTYVTEILFGVGTDTGDVLGIINTIGQYDNKTIEGLRLKEELKKMVGKMSQKYPAYSSKSFAGSYEDVRNAGIVIKLSRYQVESKDVDSDQIRKKELVHTVEIYSVDLLEMLEINSNDLLQKIKTDISGVSGDFRQDEIVKVWEETLSDISSTFQMAKIRLNVTSGFYVRQFAEDLGEKLGLPAIAFSIVREQVGEWGISDCRL